MKMPHLVHAIGHVKINTTMTETVVREATEILGLQVTYSDDRRPSLVGTLGRPQSELDVWRQPHASHRRCRSWQSGAASLFLRVQGIQRLPEARRPAGSI